ncbi:MAG: sulfatase-like hydrolase/transferase [Pirellulaceae bacterium]
MARIHSQFCSILVTLLVTAVSVASQPNVVVVVSDDQGWGDLSLHGNSNLHTPHLDQLAAEGACVEHFFVCPVCSPTRAELLTGRYHPRCGVFSTSSGGERLNLDEHTMAESFSSAGYRTAAFGKWHNGTQPPYHPNSRGFDEFYGFCSGHWGNYFSPVLEHNGQLVRGNGFTTDDFTDKAIDFIHNSCTAEQPFFVLLAYNTPHSPMQVPDRWWNKFANKELNQFGTRKNAEDINHTRAALAMCENIDWNVGRLLDKLDALAMAHNTIVVFLSDNGPNGDRWNGQMKGRKGSTERRCDVRHCFSAGQPRISPGTIVKQNAAVIIPVLNAGRTCRCAVQQLETAGRSKFTTLAVRTKNTGNRPHTLFALEWSNQRANSANPLGSSRPAV